MRKNTLIIVGNIASGKSTAMALLAKQLDARQIHADELFQTTDPFAQDYLKDIARWAFANELWLTIERSTLIHKALARKSKKLTIIDSGLLMSWVYAYSHNVTGNMTPAEWELYQRLYETVSKKVLRRITVLMLYYPVETLMKRMKKRGRKFELKYYTKKYLQDIQKGLGALKKALETQGIPTIVIEEKDCPDFEVNQVDLEHVLKKVQASLGGGN